jgi:hypothetical protein
MRFSVEGRRLVDQVSPSRGRKVQRICQGFNVVNRGRLLARFQLGYLRLGHARQFGKLASSQASITTKPL